jgi:hypothetical protein
MIRIHVPWEPHKGVISHKGMPSVLRPSGGAFKGELRLSGSLLRLLSAGL